MDKYNQHWVAKLFGKEKWAITLGQTTYYSCPRYEVSREWEWHENYHKQQWYEEGALKFIVKYLWYMVTKGYYSNNYEVEARCYVDAVLAGIRQLSVPRTTNTACN